VGELRSVRIDWTKSPGQLKAASSRTHTAIKNAIERGKGKELTSMFGYKAGAAGIGEGSNIYPAYLSIQKPLDMRSLPAKNISPNVLRKFLEGLGVELPNRDFLWSGRDLYQVLNVPGIAADIRESARAKGFDGIIFPDYYDPKTRGTSYIAFDAKQIKSPFDSGITIKEKPNYSLGEKAASEVIPVEKSVPSPGDGGDLSFVLPPLNRQTLRPSIPGPEKWKPKPSRTPGSRRCSARTA